MELIIINLLKLNKMKESRFEHQDENTILLYIDNIPVCEFQQIDDDGTISVLDPNGEYLPSQELEEKYLNMLVHHVKNDGEIKWKE